MMELEILPPEPDGGLLELGELLGRHQAFTAVAGRCSALQVACLRKIRDERGYRATGLDWRQFCSQRLGMTRTYADRLIQNLNEFGPGYFDLSQVVRISPETFRRIGGAVSDAGIEIEGEIVPIRPENSQRISEAVEALRGKARKREKPSLKAAESKLEASLTALSELTDAGLEGGEKERLLDLIAHGLRQLTVMSKLAG
jgi:hypothetical protein